MVFIKDEGSLFDAPIDVAWTYLQGGGAHGSAHHHVRNAKFESTSERTFLMSTERKRNGRWTKVSARGTGLPPLGMVFEMLSGPHAGSKMFYIYSPKGDKTQIDVYGDFTSKTLPPAKLERDVLDDLAREYNDDVPLIRDLARSKSGKPRRSSPGAVVRIRDQGSVFEVPTDTLWNYLMDGKSHDGVHLSTRNGSFEGDSKTSFYYSSERRLNARWWPEKIWIGFYPPLGFAFDWIKGPLSGSKMFYVYVPNGDRTQIDVHAEFRSKVFPQSRLRQTVSNFLETEFQEDAVAIRAFAAKE